MVVVRSLATSNASSEIVVRCSASDGWERSALRRETVLCVQSDIVIGELAHPKVVHTDDLGFFGGAEAEEGNEVEDPEDDGGHDERVSKAGGGVGELISELDVVVIEPASRNDSEAVKGGNGALGKETGHNVSDHAPNCVGCKHIKAVVVVKQELELGGEIASGTSDDTERDSRRGTDEPRRRGDSNETGDRAGAETDNGPLLLETVIPNHPSQPANARCKVGHDARLGSAQVRGKGRPAVETEPAEPEEDCAKDDVGGIVGLVREALGSIAGALSEVDGDRECGGSG